MKQLKEVEALKLKLAQTNTMIDRSSKDDSSTSAILPTVITTDMDYNQLNHQRRIQEINIQDIIDKMTFVQEEQYKLFQTMHQFLMAFSCKTPPKWQLCLYSCDLYNDYLMVKKRKQMIHSYSCLSKVILC